MLRNFSVEELTIPIKYGKSTRMNFSKKSHYSLPTENLVEIQKKSFSWFLEEGIAEILKEASPIYDFGDNFILEFISHELDSRSKYDIEECKIHGATYAYALRVRVRLINKNTGEIKEQDVYMGEIPMMTEYGTFIINGIERVVVSQIVRSPGFYVKERYDKNGKRVFYGQLIPTRGAWLEFETDSDDLFYVRIDRTRKFVLTVLVRALGIETDEEILSLFGNSEIIKNCLDKDVCKNSNDALREVYKKIRPSEPYTLESAKIALNNLFFDTKRCDYSRVGRFKLNKKFSLASKIANQVAYYDTVDEKTGEILVCEGETITSEKAQEIENLGITVVYIKIPTQTGPVKIISNGMVNADSFLSKEVIERCNLKEKLRFSVLANILNTTQSEKLEEELISKREDLMPRTAVIDDIFCAINHMLNIYHGLGEFDNIDHLGNRRVRGVGELIQNQFRLAFVRLERVVKERMAIQDIDSILPQTLINSRPLVGMMKEFFGTSQLSQFLEQTNPLSELGHKRRLSALGVGGLSRDRAGFEVRDINYTHYGRVCPVETPEGGNIGLINSLALYARTNRYGFLEAPLWRVDKKTGRVTEEVVYLSTDEEDKYYIAQANEPVDKKGHFLNKKIVVRFNKYFREVLPKEVDFVDLSSAIVSVATSLIPFLENDDAARALMGSNMQRQAVPLLVPKSPMVGTGLEHRVALDSGHLLVAEEDCVIKKVSASIVEAEGKSGTKRYILSKFSRSNHGTCFNQKVTVTQGEKLKKGDVIADGSSIENGELALGRDVMVAFVPWCGYTFEDAILLSERLVQDDVFTSIHIEKYEINARDTKLGPEVLTRDIPNVSEDSLRDLDENGIIRIGAEVRSGDILVGKITPKGEAELSAEEKLLRAIFGEKAREVRDSSLRVPHGENGTVVDVKIFSRTVNDELPLGVNTLVRVLIAQKRKISVGDKMAGRHGNKGVVSRIASEVDMPFLEDGTPVDIVLNPLGVLPRMNIGQILETHLGYAAMALGLKFATPVFDGAKKDDVLNLLRIAGKRPDGKSVLRDGRTGEVFDNLVTVGYMHMLKLAHLVDDKIHARSTGPYSLVTQQPLGGKAQFGGQRFGEMEVWALYAYGAAFTLQEILTVKSDDVAGRVKLYEAIVKGENIPTPGLPESFKVLIKELQSLGFSIKILDRENKEIIMSEIFNVEQKSKLNIPNFQKNDENRHLTEDLEADLGTEMNLSDTVIEEISDAFEEIANNVSGGLLGNSFNPTLDTLNNSVNED